MPAARPRRSRRPAALGRLAPAVFALGLVIPAAAPAEDFPSLRPLDELLESGPRARLSLDTGSALATQAARLVARAEALRAREVVDAATRARMAALRGLLTGD